MRIKTHICIFIMFVIGVRSYAQEDLLEKGKALYAEGDFKAAHELLTIAEGISQFDAERDYYSALSLKGMGELVKFRSKVEQIQGRYSELSAAQREKMDAEFIDAVFRTRAYEQARVLSEVFPTSHTQSNYAKRIRMIELLASYEQGAKKSLEGKNWWPGSSAEAIAIGEKNWATGTAMLRHFLSNAGDLERIMAVDESGISEKYKTRLVGDIWKARLILGEESQLLDELKESTPEVWEYFHYIRAWTAFQYYPEDINRAVALFQEYQETYPDSIRTVEILQVALKVCFYQGRYLKESGRLSRNRGNKEIGQTDIQRSQNYWTTYRDLVDTYVTESIEGLTDNDRDEIEHNYCISLYREKHFEELTNRARKAASMREYATRAWADFMIFEAIGLSQNDPSNLEGAIDLLDEVIAADVEDPKRNVHMPTIALLWRALLAKPTRDREVLVRILDKLENEIPDNQMKAKAISNVKYFIESIDSL